MNEEKRSDNRGRWLYLVLIFLLLGLNGWLFYNAFQNKEDRLRSAQQIEEARILYSQLEVQFNESKRELMDQKGDFSKKDSLITALEGELDARRNEITTLLKTCNFFNGGVTNNQKKESKSRGGGIRTPGTRERTLDFESSAFSHSATPPKRFDGA